MPVCPTLGVATDRSSGRAIRGVQAQGTQLPSTVMRLRKLVRRALPGRIASRLRKRRLGSGAHRGYVGGNWQQVGRLQFEFLVAHGLRPEHVLLDIACGSLRGGVHFIPYLDRGNYLGIDQEEALIHRGCRQELPENVRGTKEPEFVVSDSFEFDRFSKVADFSLAVSLFTHLIVRDVELCFGNLRAYVAPAHTFYASFRVGDSGQNPPESHPLKRFFYSPDELTAIAARNGWRSRHVGDWGHPRGQVMMQFTPE